MRDAISTKGAPQAIGPYSQADPGGRTCSSCRARATSTRRRARWSTATWPRRRAGSWRTSARSSRPAGASFDHVVRTTVYLADMNDFAAMNEVYGEYFAAPAPARTTIQVARLPRDVRVEIDVIAIL